MTDSIFTKIINGDIPANKVYEDEHCIAINDIAPQAPIHVLIIPKKPIVKLADADDSDQALMGHLLIVVGKIARQLGVEEGFRLIVNNGEAAGQTVFHLHLHLIAGKNFAETKMV